MESEIGKVVFQHDVDIPYVAPTTISITTSVGSPSIEVVVISNDED